jgi:hypothetical protein
MTASVRIPFVLTVVIVTALSLVQASCPADDSSIEDCSRRNKPQYHVQDGEWTCKDREKR